VSVGPRVVKVRDAIEPLEEDGWRHSALSALGEDPMEGDFVLGLPDRHDLIAQQRQARPDEQRVSVAGSNPLKNMGTPTKSSSRHRGCRAR
jgi:hypothetical protein